MDVLFFRWSVHYLLAELFCRLDYDFVILPANIVSQTVAYIWRVSDTIIGVFRTYVFIANDGDGKNCRSKRGYIYTNGTMAIDCVSGRWIYHISNLL